MPTRFAAAWLIAALMAVRAGAGEFSVAEGAATAAASRWAALTARPAEVSLAEPTYKSAAPLYLALPAGDDLDSLICGALDVPAGAEDGPLYLDANNNNDLRDDPPLALSLVEGSPARERVTPAVKLTVRYFDGTERQVSVRLRLRKTLGRADWCLSAEMLDHAEGQVDLGDQNGVLIGLYDTPSRDGPANGCFNNYGVDRLRIDANGNGRLEGPGEETLLSKVFEFRGRLWQLGVDSGARDVTAAPYDRAAGRLKIGSKFAAPDVKLGRIRLSAGADALFICPFPMADFMLVPAGNYSVASEESVSMVDDKGTPWMAQFALTSPLKVAPDAETAIALGPPFTVTPSVSGSSKLGGRLSTTYTLKGAAGELYEKLAPPNRRVPPAVKVMQADGTVVAQGPMEYG